MWFGSRSRASAVNDPRDIARVHAVGMGFERQEMLGIEPEPGLWAAVHRATGAAQLGAGAALTILAVADEQGGETAYGSDRGVVVEGASLEDGRSLICCSGPRSAGQRLVTVPGDAVVAVNDNHWLCAFVVDPGTTLEMRAEEEAGGVVTLWCGVAP